MLAVDGGNTKTLAAVAGPDGRALGAGKGGMRRHLQRALPRRGARRDQRRGRATRSTAAGVTPDAIEAAAFSLAGADWPEDFALLEGALRERLGLGVAAARGQRRDRRAARGLA